jgi:multimeric flavodoxin WrbA
MNDGLTPALDRISRCDTLILGSPIYWHTETGAMRSFIERLVFPYMEYRPDYPSIVPKKIPLGLVYTMNVREEELSNYPQHTMMEATRNTLARFFGSCEVLLCTDTFQFSDYSKYVSTVWDAEAKARRRAEIFPQDCARAFEMGRRLAAAAAEGGSVVASQAT